MPPTEETSATVQGGGYDEHPFIADLYEQDPLHRGRPDVGFFVEEARTSGSPVLDIGCGTGRVLIPTARAGLEVVGLDLSPRMLAVCRERLLGEPDEVRTRAHVIEADMRRFDLGQRFRLAMIPFRSFQYLLTIEDQLTCLAEIRRHLRTPSSTSPRRSNGTPCPRVFDAISVSLRGRALADPRRL